MKKVIAVGLMTGIMLGFSGSANATLVGDSVNIAYVNRIQASDGTISTNSPWSMTYGPIADDTSDSQNWWTFNIDINSNTINFNALGQLSLGADNPITGTTGILFNGIVIDSINDNSGNSVKSVTINTNLNGWDNSMLTMNYDTLHYNTNNLWLDWKGLPISTGTYFNITLDFSPPATNGSPVPEPTTMLLFGTGLAGLAAVGRRKRV